MNNTQKIAIIGIALVAIFCVKATFAQDTTTTTAINQEISVTAQDLGVSEPKILPNSFWYFLKDISRGMQSTFTFNPVKKAELKMKFASEKLLEIKKMTEKKKSSDGIKKATDNYEKELDKVKTAVEEIKSSTSTMPAIGKFLEKYNAQQILHQGILEKLSQRASTSTMEKIQEARERHLEKFKEVMQKLEDKTRAKNCPQFSPPAPGFCPNGKIIAKKGENGCMMPPKCVIKNNASSTDNEDSTSTKPIIVGGDRDKHGCIGSAGYSWCEAKKKCLRPWEEKCAKPIATSTTSNIKPIAPVANDCNCVNTVKPVCGSDNKTYINSCLAKCAGKTIKNEGICKEIHLQIGNMEVDAEPVE